VVKYLHPVSFSSHLIRETYTGNLSQNLAGLLPGEVFLLYLQDEALAIHFRLSWAGSLVSSGSCSNISEADTF